MTTYEKIREILNKEMPERLELVEGCEVDITDWYGNSFITPHILEHVWIENKKEHIKGKIFEQEWVYRLSDNQLMSVTQINYSKEYPRCADKNKKIKILGKPPTLFECTQLVTDKHKLLDMWQKSELLSDQTEEVQEWIVGNLLHKKDIAV